MSNQAMEWLPRVQNFEKAFTLLEPAVNLSKNKPLSELEKHGLIHCFEFTHELAWNVLKNYFEYQGNSAITGSMDATREAFNKGLIKDGEGWLDMIKSRNQSSHTYNEDVANEITNKIIQHYYSLFADFKNKIKTLTA